MVGISNLYIKDILDELPLKHWTGVFSIDQLTLPIPEDDFAVIVNFSDLNEKGTHFVTLANIKKHLVLFDSLATPLPLPLRISTGTSTNNHEYIQWNLSYAVSNSSY